jgi:hypothetical protein
MAGSERGGRRRADGGDARRARCGVVAGGEQEGGIRRGTAAG